MPSIQRIILFVASICFLVLVLHLIRKQHLAVKHSLLWIVLGIVGIAAAVFPSWVFALADLFGFQLPVNFIFFVCIFFSIVAILSVSITMSTQANTIRGLIQEISLLKQQVELLETERNASTQHSSENNRSV